MREIPVSRKTTILLFLICIVCTAQLGIVEAEPVFRYVEFNGERKWPGQTHIVTHGITLQVMAALEEPQKQSMTAELILIDENGDARIEQMEQTSKDQNKEWHTHDLDTSTLNLGSYTVRIRATNAGRAEQGDEKAIKSEEVTWGDLTLILETQHTTQSSSGTGGITFRGTIIDGMIIALYLVVSALIPVAILRVTRKRD
jgi:hypothetical protein